MCDKYCSAFGHKKTEYFTSEILRFLAPQVGLEPTTLRLTAACSTSWAIEEYVKFFAKETPAQLWRLCIIAHMDWIVNTVFKIFLYQSAENRQLAIKLTPHKNDVSLLLEISCIVWCCLYNLMRLKICQFSRITRLSPAFRRTGTLNTRPSFIWVKDRDWFFIWRIGKLFK